MDTHPPRGCWGGLSTQPPTWIIAPTSHLASFFSVRPLQSPSAGASVGSTAPVWALLDYSSVVTPAAWRKEIAPAWCSRLPRVLLKPVGPHPSFLQPCPFSPWALATEADTPLLLDPCALHSEPLLLPACQPVCSLVTSVTSSFQGSARKTPPPGSQSQCDLNSPSSSHDLGPALCCAFPFSLLSRSKMRVP